jgi:DNA-binding IclR family transcriptional regulator
MPDPVIKAKSLASAIRLLEYFTNDRPEWGVSELSERSGLCKSNVHSFLTTYVALGYMERTPTDKYALGMKFLRLAHVISKKKGYRELIYPCIQAIAQRCNETVYYAQRNENQVVYMDVAYPDNAIITRSMMGEIAPLYCTGLGKAILAAMQDEEIWPLMEFPLQSYTEATITAKEELKNQLRQIRQAGYAIDDMEHEYGVKCVAKAVSGFNGRLIGAISVSGPSLRFSEERISFFVSVLNEEIAVLKQRAGWALQIEHVLAAALP